MLRVKIDTGKREHTQKNFTEFILLLEDEKSYTEWNIGIIITERV